MGDAIGNSAYQTIAGNHPGRLPLGSDAVQPRPQSLTESTIDDQATEHSNRVAKPAGSGGPEPSGQAITRPRNLAKPGSVSMGPALPPGMRRCPHSSCARRFRSGSAQVFGVNSRWGSQSAARRALAQVHSEENVPFFNAWTGGSVDVAAWRLSAGRAGSSTVRIPGDRLHAGAAPDETSMSVAAELLGEVASWGDAVLVGRGVLTCGRPDGGGTAPPRRCGGRRRLRRNRAATGRW